MKKVKSGNNPPDGLREQKLFVNVDDASFSLMMGISTKEWDDIPYPRHILCQT